MKQMLLGLFALLMLLVPSCASRSVVPKPTSITLEQALGSVGTGLRTMKENLGETKTGLLPTEATVTFVISASGNDKNTLVLGLAPIPISSIGSSLKVDNTTETVMAAQRSNTITIKFENIAKMQNPKDVIAALKAAGITTFSQAVPVDAFNRPVR